VPSGPSRLAALVVAIAGLVVAAPAAAVTPTTVRAVSATGQELNGATYFPAVSTDGRWLVFVSSATNAVAGVTSGIPQVFLLDHSTGQIRLVSKAPRARRATVRARSRR
jgi:hypothetical protein